MAAALAGCDRDDQIQSYRSPKEPQKAAAPALPTAPVASASSATADSGIASWTAPPEWKLDPAPRPMRLMTFFIQSEKGQAEVFITQKMPKSTFDLPSNINRWRGQVMLPPTNDTSIHGPKKVTVAGESAQLFEFLGTDNAGKPKRLLLAMLTRGEDNWFFRITGPADLVTQQQSAFEAFLNSIKFAG